MSMPPMERKPPRQREASDEQAVGSDPIIWAREQSRQGQELIIEEDPPAGIQLTGKPIYDEHHPPGPITWIREQSRQGQESISAEERRRGPIERAPTREKGELGALHVERDRAAREHIGLPSLANLAQTLHDAQVRLDKPSLDEADRVVVREALSNLEVLASDQLWAALETAAHEQDQAGLRDRRAALVGEVEHDEELRAALREAVAGELDQAGLREFPDALIGHVQPGQRVLTELLGEAPSEQVGGRIRQVTQVGKVAPIVVAVRTDVVSSFVDRTRQFVVEPLPPVTDEQGQAAWVRRAKALLKEGYALLSNIMVAAAFTLPAVQRAVQHAAHTSTEFAHQALSNLGSAVPSLLAVTTLAAMVGMGIELYEEYRPLASAAERPEPGNEPRPADPGALEPSDADMPTSRETGIH
jgi:hypothetical protein